MNIAPQPTKRAAMVNNPDYIASMEYTILLFLCIAAYLFAMVIQVRDPKINVTYSDWILGFIASAIGGTIAFLWALYFANVGTRAFVTVFATLVSYRSFKFIVSSEAQDAFAKGFFNGILNAISRIFNNNNQDGADR
jgi:hypothetical protein